MPIDTNCPQQNTEAILKIPFDSKKHAEIAYRVLSVDHEPRRNFVEKDINLVEDFIEVKFTADQVKNLRTAITSFFEALLLCKETIKTFDLETTSENARAHTGTDTT